MNFRYVFSSLLVLAGFLALLDDAHYAHAGDSIVVGSTDDTGPLTLRAAIQNANSSPQADQISFDSSVFPPGSPATITLATALPEIKGSSPGITIDATNAGVVIDGIQLHN